jgi:hypothetical protein
VPTGAAQTFNLGRTNIILSESSYTGGFNLSHKFVLAEGKELEFKTGLFAESKNRKFDARNLGYVKSNSSLFNIGTLPIDQIFAESNINTTNGVKLDEQTNPSDSYTATNDLLAAYIQGGYALGTKLNLVAGVRAENNSQKLNSFDMTGKTPINYNNTVLNVLPSFNLTYNFSCEYLNSIYTTTLTTFWRFR